MSFTSELCFSIELALENKFPGINADCEFVDGEIEIIFEEGNYSSQQVTEFMGELKKMKYKVPNQLPKIQQ